MDGGVWWGAVHGVAKSRTQLSDVTFTFHFHALEKEVATHSSVLAWRIPGTGEPGGLPSMGSHTVGHDWSDLAAAVQGHVRVNTGRLQLTEGWMLSILYSFFFLVFHVFYTKVILYIYIVCLFLIRKKWITLLLGKKYWTGQKSYWPLRNFQLPFCPESQDFMFSVYGGCSKLYNHWRLGTFSFPLFDLCGNVPANKRK